MLKRLLFIILLALFGSSIYAQNTYTKQYELSGIEEVDSGKIKKATGCVKVKYNNDFNVVELKYVVNPESYWHVIKLENVILESSPRSIVCKREDDIIFEIKESGDGYSYILLNYSKIKNKNNEASN